jgi:hypothetical protein
MVFFWIWFGLMMWFVPGYMAGKAALRADKSDRGAAVFMLLLGPFSYLLTWAFDGENFARVHGIKKHDPNKPYLVNRFFGEV